MVGEHIGALQVVVVTEIEVESLRTGRQVLFHHRAGSEHTSHEEACREFMYQISERHGHLFVFNNRCGILQFAVCILRVVHFFCRLTASVVSHYFLSGGATLPHYRCSGVLYAPLLLGLSAYVLACDGQSQRKRGVAIPIYIIMCS